MQFCMLHYWFASNQQVITNTLLCSWFLVNDLIFSCKNFLSVVYMFSPPKELWWVLRDNWEYILDMILPQLWNILNYPQETYYSSTFRLSLWWISFSNIRGRKKTIGKRYWLEWIIVISSWSSYKRMWTCVIVLNCFISSCCNFFFELTLFVCVWRWSCNLLHGSKYLCRWARGCLDLEWGQPGVLLRDALWCL